MPAQQFPTEIWHSSEPLELEGGDRLAALDIAYETWGTLSPQRDNVVVILHALSGSSHALSSPENSEPGWWEAFARESSPLHPRSHFIVCANLLGGCYGSTGPRANNPATGQPYRTGFPQITIGDMIEAHRRLLKALGIDRPVTLIGGSMGGMLVLQWSVAHPDEVARGIVLAAPARSYAQTIALRAVQREAIMGDPRWNGGNYDDDRFPAEGLALARKIGMITYRSEAEFEARFGRDMRDKRLHFLEGFFEVQSYLAHQGKKFVARFDPNTYLYYSRAMDLYDLAQGHASLEAAVSRIRARTLLIAIDSDILCPASQVREVHDALRQAGREVSLRFVHSVHGHDAFLIESEQIHALIAEFLAAE